MISKSKGPVLNIAEIFDSLKKKNISVMKYALPNFRADLLTIEKVWPYITAHYV